MFNGFYGRLCTISFYFTTDIPDRSSFRYCGTETAIPTNGMCHLKEDSLPYKGSISCYENIIRADSNFSCIPFYELTDRYTLHYTIGLASNEVLKRRVARVEKAVHMLYVESREKYQHFFYFEYATGIWHKKQTYYAKVESTGIGLNTRLIVSNMDPKDAQEVYFNFYVMRGGGGGQREQDQRGEEHVPLRPFVLSRFLGKFLSFAKNSYQKNPV